MEDIYIKYIEKRKPWMLFGVKLSDLLKAWLALLMETG